MTKQKIFSRSLIHSKKFWLLRSDKERLFYMLVLLDLDNIGRGQGNKYYLKGKLYEKIEVVTPEDCEQFLVENHKIGILITYKIEGIRYIQDPKHLEHNKIVGNMRAESIYPSPPQEVIEEWEKLTSENYTLSNLIKQGLSEGKGKDEDKEEDKGKDEYGEFVLLTKKEYQQLIDKYEKKIVKEFISRLDNYIGSKGKKYKSHYHTILTWIDKDQKESNGKTIKDSNPTHKGKYAGIETPA